MKSALDFYNEQQANRHAISQQIRDEDFWEVDLEKFMVEAYHKTGVNADPRGLITDGMIIRTMDGSSTIKCTVHDHDRAILASDLWKYTLEVSLGGYWWRLVQCTKSGDDLNLVFEDIVPAWLRGNKDPYKVSRSKMTRAEFIQHMVSQTTADNKTHTPIKFFSPELHKKQPIASQKQKTTVSERRALKQGGLSGATDLTVKGAPATGEQLKIGEAVLDVGTSMNANAKVLISSIMVIIDESTISNPAGGDADSRGAFQQQKYINGVRTHWPASRDVRKDAAGYFKDAIAEDKHNPTEGIQMLCQNVQLSGTPDGSNYGKWHKEAVNWVQEYTGGTSGSGQEITTTRSFAEPYQFTRGQPGGPALESTYDAANRLADEVQWYFWNVLYTVYYMNKKDILAQNPVALIDEGTEGVENIDFDWDTGKKVNECTVTARTDKWEGLPGEVIKIKPTMGPIGQPGNDRWMIWEIQRPFYSTLTEITLKLPLDPKKEPAPTLTSGQVDGTVLTSGAIKGGTSREKIVKAAKAAMQPQYHYHYLQRRPMSSNLFSKRAQQGIDCSEFATLVYRAAGVGDPNGNNYDGNGNTDTLRANGKKVANPQPGDLIFYSGFWPDHVAVYIGGGKVIECGGDPCPREMPVNYRPDNIGAYTYDLAVPAGGRAGRDEQSIHKPRP